MQPAPPASGRAGRLLLIAAALVVLLAVVALASRSGFGHGGHAKPNNAYVSYAFTLFLILFVVTIPVAIWTWIIRTREEGAQQTSLFRRGVGIVLFVAVFSSLLWVRRWFHLHFHSPFGHGHAAHNPTQHAHGRPNGHGPANESSPAFEWTVLWIALGLAVVGSACAFYLYRRAKPERSLEERDVVEDVVATISDAIDDLEREPDPRRAVIAAYARMEGVLGRHGLGRRPSETPVEYLRRVLLDLTTSTEAVERLTSLFERAKFSNHEVTEQMKRDAIAALTEIRDGIDA